MSFDRPWIADIERAWRVVPGDYVIADVSSMRTSLSAKSDISDMFGAFDVGDTVRLSCSSYPTANGSEYEVWTAKKVASVETRRNADDFADEGISGCSTSHRFVKRGLTRSGAVSTFWLGAAVKSGFFSPLYQIVPADSPEGRALASGVPRTDVFVGEEKVVR